MRKQFHVSPLLIGARAFPKIYALHNNKFAIKRKHRKHKKKLAIVIVETMLTSLGVQKYTFHLDCDRLDLNYTSHRRLISMQM